MAACVSLDWLLSLQTGSICLNIRNSIQLADFEKRYIIPCFLDLNQFITMISITAQDKQSHWVPVLCKCACEHDNVGFNLNALVRPGLIMIIYGYHTLTCAYNSRLCSFIRLWNLKFRTCMRQTQDCALSGNGLLV